MLAIVIDHSAPAHVRTAEVPEPTPAPHELVVEVRAVSVDPGELVGRIPNGENGDVPGWDAAGVVVRAAFDGSGPRVGEHVSTFGDSGGWAQFRAVSFGPR